MQDIVCGDRRNWEGMGFGDCSRRYWSPVMERENEGVSLHSGRLSLLQHLVSRLRNYFKIHYSKIYWLKIVIRFILNVDRQIK